MSKSKKKKNKELRVEEMTAEEKMKYEIAAEMGLLDRVLEDGWQSLSAKETGRIGGMLGSRRKAGKKLEGSGNQRFI